MATKTPAKKSTSKRTKRASTRTSRKSIRKTAAPYARKAGDDEDDDGDKGKKAKKEGTNKGTDADKGSDKAAAKAKADDKGDAKAAKESPSKPAPSAPVAKDTPKQDAPKKDSPKVAEKPAEKPAEPAEKPAAPAPAPAASAGDDDEYADLIPPDAIEKRDPNSPAQPPGKAPPGDSRSFRRTRDGVEEFVLIYRAESSLVIRGGKVGTYGTVKVTSFPHMGAAAHAYAQECSDLTGAGYRDLD